MRYVFTTVFLLIFIGSAHAAEISGKVTVNGRPAGDYAIAYLVSEDPNARPPEPITATILQEGFKFNPDFLIVTPGSTVRFENNDHEIHNAKSYSKPNAFDIGAHMPNTVKEVVLKEPGIVVLRCKVHHQMRGTILVLPSAWFAQTDENGSFSLNDVPAGPYRLEGWLLGMDAKEVADSAVHLEVEADDRREVALDVRTTHAVGPMISSDRNRNWEAVVTEIHADLRRGFSTWQGGRAEAAERIVMAAYYERFGRSGLRSLISQELGERRGRQLERRFLEIASLIRTTDGVTSETERQIQSRIDDLGRQLAIDLSRFSLDFSRP